MPSIFYSIYACLYALYVLSVVPRHHCNTSLVGAAGLVAISRIFTYISHLSTLFSLYIIKKKSPLWYFYSSTGHVASCMHARDYLYIKLSPREVEHKASGSQIMPKMIACLYFG
jgi:hypothetical protein